MKISILVHNLSNNCVGRAMVIASLLDKDHEIEIIGPKIEENIWAPAKGKVKIKVLSNKIKDLLSDLKKIDGDLLYVIKPRLANYGYAIIKKIFNKKKIILDIDDWEVGIVKESKKFTYKSLLNDPNNLLFVSILDKLTYLADERTVSSTFLQKKYGGTILVQVKDTDFFNPIHYKNLNIKKKLGLESKKIIMFIGTVRKHKGIELIIEALDTINDPRIVFVVIGDYRNYQLLERKYIYKIPMQPLEKVPEYLSAADLVVLPQTNSKSAIGQVPSKLFDAMAMGKPIISTHVSDIPLILKDCGVIVPPNNVQKLAEAIIKIFKNYNHAIKLGLKARQKCIDSYSFKSNSTKINKIIASLSK